MSTTTTTTRASQPTADAAFTLKAGATETGPAPPLPSRFEPLCHPLMESVAAEVDGYFLQHWPFDSDKSRQKFLDAGFSRVTCLYFPKALDDRIHFACRLLTVLFLIDGMCVGPRPLSEQNHTSRPKGLDGIGTWALTRGLWYRTDRSSRSCLIRRGRGLQREAHPHLPRRCPPGPVHPGRVHHLRSVGEHEGA